MRGLSVVCGRGSTLPRHCHPHQFLLKSFEFSGAKTAMKRFCSGKWDLPPQKSPAPTVHAAGHDWKFERALALSSSPRSFGRLWKGMVSPCLSLRLMLPQRCGYTARAVQSFLRSHRTHRSCRTGDSAPSGSARMPSVRNSPARSPSRRGRRPSGA